MDTVEDRFKELSKSMSASYKRMADQTAGRTLGEHVMELLRKNGDISVAGLRQALTSSIELSESACGAADPELDQQRLNAEAALKVLDQLLASRDS